MKRLLNKITGRLADAALLATGVPVALTDAKAGEARETLEENLIEVAFAEAADYDSIHRAIQRAHREAKEIARPDECQYADNDTCFRHAA